MTSLGLECIENRELMAANCFAELIGGNGPTPPAVELNLSSGQEPGQVGLLLPAVQKVREAAARMGQIQVQWDLAAPQDSDALIGLLLPAVQKVR